MINYKLYNVKSFMKRREANMKPQRTQGFSLCPQEENHYK